MGNAKEGQKSAQDQGSQGRAVSRRAFVGGAAAAGAGVLLYPWIANAQKVGRELRVGLIGAGSQGRNLIMAGLKIPGIRFAAICDIWRYHQKYSSNVLKRYDQPVQVYEDYRDLLEKERDLDAVIIATPDWMHPSQTEACLNAGLAVYCEKEMAHTLEGCQQMVRAARRTKGLLQIGHQRRSNPRYLHARKLIQEEKILGRVLHANGQWNRSRRLERGWPKKYPMDKGLLKDYGYGSMEEFRNWRWYQKYSGGPMADLGSHQVDIYNWMLGTEPTGVMAVGGTDYYKDREWFDDVMALYEYQTHRGSARGFYQVLNTSSHGGYFETFMGDEGTLLISEDSRKGFLFREIEAPSTGWTDIAKKIEMADKRVIELNIAATRTNSMEVEMEELDANISDLNKPVHQPHLENFFAAVRGQENLNCPAEEAYKTAVTIFKTNKAVESGKRISLKADDFEVS